MGGGWTEDLPIAFAFSSMIGISAGGVAGVFGLGQGNIYPNIDDEYVIDSNEWVIVENE